MALGQSRQRKDAEGKVTGRARYTDDFTMPGMRHAVFVRSPLAHARVRGVDTAAALTLSGVDAIFTAQDVPAILFPTAGHPFSIYPDHGDVSDRRLLTDHVRYFGDEVAVVVARDLLTARKAAELVKVDYEPLPVMTTPDAALAAGAIVLHPAVRESNLLAESTLAVGGELDDALRRAHRVVEGAYTTPMVQHCHLENMTAYAYMDDMERIVVVSSTQIPHICRRVVGQALGIPWGRVRVIKPCIGGGFGNKQDVCLEPMVAFLTRAMGGLPVRIELSREDCMLATRVRHPFAMHMRVGVTEHGDLTGYGLEVESNTGAYASHGHSIAMAGGSKACYVYPRVPYAFHARTVYTNLPVGGAFRGYGSPQVCFAVECAMEDAARSLGMDSLAFRLKNAGRPGDLSPLNGKPLVSHGVMACMERGSELFGYHQRKERCRAANAAAVLSGSPLRQGVGLALFSYGTGTYPINVEAGSARLVLNQDGSVNVSCGATEIGQGADTAFAQMVAETLGIDFDRVRVLSTQDTDVTPFDTGAYASRQTYTTAPALHEASLALKRKMLEHASLMSGHEPSALDVRGEAVVFVREPERALMSLGELAMDAYYNRDRGGQLTAEASVKSRQSPPAFGCTFAHVDVDLALCRVRIVDLLNVHDSGRIVNPLMASGQVHGGMAMGIGWALYEELLADPVTGEVRNNNLLDYKFPTMCDVPDLDCAFVETVEPSGPYGTKALGEPPLISVAPALRNAILDATGVAVNSLPMNPKTLFTAFSAAGVLRDPCGCAKE